jgi:ATP-dependent Lon protease
VYTSHVGLVTEYLAEVLREFRKSSYADYADKHFRFGPHLGGRDQKAVRKIVSALVKILHPNGEVSKAKQNLRSTSLTLWRCAGG